MKAIEIARLKKENEELKGRIKNLEWQKERLNRELEKTRKTIKNFWPEAC